MNMDGSVFIDSHLTDLSGLIGDRAGSFLLVFYDNIGHFSSIILFMWFRIPWMYFIGLLTWLVWLRFFFWSVNGMLSCSYILKTSYPLIFMPCCWVFRVDFVRYYNLLSFNFCFIFQFSICNKNKDTFRKSKISMDWRWR